MKLKTFQKVIDELGLGNKKENAKNLIKIGTSRERFSPIFSWEDLLKNGDVIDDYTKFDKDLKQLSKNKKIIYFRKWNKESGGFKTDEMIEAVDKAVLDFWDKENEVLVIENADAGMNINNETGYYWERENFVFVKRESIL